MAIAALESAAAKRIHSIVVARAKHQSTGSASFPEIIDRLAIELDLRALGDRWREVSRAHAMATWRSALVRSLAYDVPLLPDADATALIAAFVESFEPDALFFRNGDANAHEPVLGTTLERGAAIVDANAVGIFFVGDED